MRWSELALIRACRPLFSLLCSRSLVAPRHLFGAGLANVFLQSSPMNMNIKHLLTAVLALALAGLPAFAQEEPPLSDELTLAIIAAAASGNSAQIDVLFATNPTRVAQIAAAVVAQAEILSSTNPAAAATAASSAARAAIGLVTLNPTAAGQVANRAAAVINSAPVQLAAQTNSAVGASVSSAANSAVTVVSNSAVQGSNPAAAAATASNAVQAVSSAVVASTNPETSANVAIRAVAVTNSPAVQQAATANTTVAAAINNTQTAANTIAAIPAVVLLFPDIAANVQFVQPSTEDAASPGVPEVRPDELVIVSGV